MERIRNFEALSSYLAHKGVRKRVAVVCPHDASSREAMAKAEEAGFIEAIVVDDPDPRTAAKTAVEMVRSGKADILMKGLVNSDILLRAVLDHDGGLLPHGNTLTHLAVAEVPQYPRLLFYTDAAVIPYPTHEQRIRQVAYIAHLCRQFGIAEPRIALIHCSEKVDARHFPFTEGYPLIAQQARQGCFGPCIVDGPLDVKTSLSAESLQVKGLSSPIGGEADALVFPDIESGNLFHKTISLFGPARIAAVLAGATAPVVLPSRSDSAASKFYSLALATIQSVSKP